jgi:hypothetical protein
MYPNTESIIDEVTSSMSRIKTHALAAQTDMESFRSHLEAIQLEIPKLMQWKWSASDLDAVDSKLRRIRRMLELRNQIEPGSFSLEITRLIESLYQKLP